MGELKRAMRLMSNHANCGDLSDYSILRLRIMIQVAPTKVSRTEPE